MLFTTLTASTPPFAVRFNEKNSPVWRAPHDTEWRPTVVPDADLKLLPAFASIGWYVTQHHARYTPAYHVVGMQSMRGVRDPNVVGEWSTDTDDYFIMIDRRMGMAIKIAANYSNHEAAVSWFIREPGHETGVLCYDRKEAMWYVESMRPECQVWIGHDGTEVHESESGAEGATLASYLIENHPHAVMVHGD